MRLASPQDVPQMSMRCHVVLRSLVACVLHRVVPIGVDNIGSFRSARARAADRLHVCCPLPPRAYLQAFELEGPGASLLRRGGAGRP